MCKATILIIHENRRLRNIDEVRARVGFALHLKPEYRGKIIEAHGCLCPIDMNATARDAGFDHRPPDQEETIEWFRTFH